MTTATYNTVLDHSSDAAFRAWSLELHNAFIACGLVQTADTGQINFATVIRPGTGLAGGYVIYRFDDAMQATAPIFMKVEYGSNSTVAPQIWLTVGRGSNGAGTITGATITTRTSTLRGSNIPSTITPYPTNVCVAPGYAGFAFKRSGVGLYYGFHICRSVDSAGAPNGDGVTVYTGEVNGLEAITAVAMSFLTNLKYPAAGRSTGYCLIPMNTNTSLFGGTAQVYKHYTVTPRMRPNPFLYTTVIAEVNENTQFTATPVGVVTHNYLALGNNGGDKASANGVSGVHGLAMLWE